MRAVIFPGQGSHFVGMGSEFYNNFSEFREILGSADEVLKFKISDIISNGPEEKLKLTQNTQPAIMITSYAIYKILEKQSLIKKENLKYFAGHSLGEYSALTCAKSLSFEDAVYLLNERGKAMQKSVPVGKGSMLAVLGCKMEILKKKINQFNKDGVCEIANDNSDAQIIVSGETNIIKNLKNSLLEEKIKSIILPVSAPFHCSLMRPAEKVMSEKINSTTFKKPEIEIISNVEAEPVKDENKIKNLLIKQICSKVRWRESIKKMNKNGVDEFIEIGPGKVLTGMIKRSLGNVTLKTVNNLEDLKKLEQ